MIIEPPPFEPVAAVPHESNQTGHMLPKLVSLRYRRYTLASCTCCARPRWFYVWYPPYGWDQPEWLPVSWSDRGMRRRIRAAGGRP